MVRDIAYLKAKFETGDVPTQEDFHDWLDTMFSFIGGSDFDPENILTNLLFGSTSSPRKLERFYDTGTGFQYTGAVRLEDSYTVLEHKRVAAGITRLAQLILTAQASLALVYDSPTGYNRLELTDSLTQILKVARYFSAPTIANDLDIPYKKWIDDNFLLASAYNNRYKGKYTTLVALQTAHPTATAGDYAQVDTGSGSPVVNYNWDSEEGWVVGSSGSSATNTDSLPEGSTNLYFTNARAIAALAATLAGKADKINNTQNTAVLFWENGIGEDLAGFYYDRTNKILNLKGALPTIRLMNADGSYISLERNVTANTFKLKNQVLQAGGIGRALRLNSSNTQYFNIPISPAIGVQHTITFWFKTTTSGVLFSNTSYSSGVTKFGEFSINSNTSVRIETDNGGTGAVTVNPTSFGITVLDGNWHFVAMCQETSTVKKTYIDNVLISSLNGSSLAGPLNSFAVGRGSSSGSTLYYTGSIDQFCVFNSVLSAANVAEIWNSGAGNGSLPVTPVRQYNFEEGAGVTVLDTIQSVTTVVQNANSAIWENIGKAPIQGSPQTATLLESNDGLTNGERGVCKVGEFNGSTILQGRYIKFLIDVYYFFVADIFGNVLIDSSNTSNSASPTAKLTVGAPTTTLAGLRLIAGVENTSTQNVGDVNHSAARRTFVKRKGTTGQTIKLSDVDTLFTGGYAAIDDPTTTGSLLAINATYGGGNIIPANFLCLSKTIELELDGTIVAGSAGNAVIAVKLGAATIASFSVATADTVTASPFFLKVKIQDINVVGEVMVTGRLELNAATYKMIGSNGGQATGVNKTTALTLDVTGTLTGTTTGGSIRCLISTAKILN